MEVEFWSSDSVSPRTPRLSFLLQTVVISVDEVQQPCVRLSEASVIVWSCISASSVWALLPSDPSYTASTVKA